MAELSVLEAFERYGSLGPDFLTWLFVSTQTEGDNPSISQYVQEIEFRGPIVLMGEGGEALKVSLSGDEAPNAPEVRSALAEGKRIVRSKLLLTVGADQFQCTLNAESFDLSGLKLPIPKTPDWELFLSDRIQAMQHLYGILDALFEAFLAIRLSPDLWKKEAELWLALAKG